MDRNVLIGNGINIQFSDKCSSSDIMERVVSGIQSDRYTPLTENSLTKDEQIATLQGLADIVNQIKAGKNIGKLDGLMMFFEVDRIKKYYPVTSTVTSIPIEDYFLIAEYFNNMFREEDGDETNEFNREVLATFLKQIILDGIYDNGRINEVYKGYYAKVGSYLDRFENVFTTNYDYNIEKVVSDSSKVCHIHGEFDKLAPEYDTDSRYYIEHKNECDDKIAKMLPGMKHIYSDCIMSWSWLDKYGELISDEAKYKKDLFCSVKGQLEIIGLAPTNDTHIISMINNNGGIKSVVYYYFSEQDRSEFQRVIQKPVAYKSVMKFWASLK